MILHFILFLTLFLSGNNNDIFPVVTGSIIYKRVGNFPYSCLGTGRTNYEKSGFYDYLPIEIEQEKLNEILSRTLSTGGRICWKWLNIPPSWAGFIGEYRINGIIYYFGIIEADECVFHLNVVKGTANKNTRLYKSYKISQRDFDFILSRVMYNLSDNDEELYSVFKKELRQNGYDTDYILDTVKIRNSLIKNENSPMSELRKNSF